MCDLKDFNEPEMHKVRPVVVLSPRLPYRSEIVTLVPLSTTAPKHALPFCVQLSKNYHPHEDDGLSCWAKCDMVLNLSKARLDSFKTGRRQYFTPELTDDDLKAVRIGVLHGLGLFGLKIEHDASI